jgi:hypothetical protein
MPNPIPPLMCVKYRGSGNVTVHKLVNGITIDPTQDGSDVLVGNLEADSGTTYHVHHNRLIEAFGKRFLLHGFRVYERNEGGDGVWGVVSEPDLGTLSATDPRHSGLHLLYPDGVPTLAFLYRSAFEEWAVAKSTDGITWTKVEPGINTGSEVSFGPSAVYRNSIYWFLGGNDTNHIRSYDFSTETASEHDVNFSASSATPCSNLHVHNDNLYFIHYDAANDTHLFRFNGTDFKGIGEITSTPTNGNGVGCLFSDGNDMIAMFNNSASNRFAFRLSNFETGSSHTKVDITNPVLNNVPTSDPRGFYPFVSADPNPSIAEQRTYFWNNSGNKSNGTFDLLRFEYRIITFSAIGGTFDLGETVTQAVSGASGDVVAVVDGVSLELTNVLGTFDATNIITGGDSGASGTATSLLSEQEATDLGTGVSATEYGLAMITDGGLDRIQSSAYPAIEGTPIEVDGDRTKFFFRVYGSGTPTITLEAFANGNAETPDTQLTLVNGTLVVESGSPATTPTISGDQITNITIDGGAALYSFQAELSSAGISKGQSYTLLLDIA